MRQKRKHPTRVEELWLQGYTWKQIAALINMNPATLYNYRNAGLLHLPARDWVLPSDVGVNCRWAHIRARAGLIELSPGGYYRKSQLLAAAENHANRTCSHVGCDKPLGTASGLYTFCEEHRKIGVNEALLMDELRKNPDGVWMSRLRNRVNSSMAYLAQTLEQLQKNGVVRMKAIRSGITSGTLVFLVEHESKAS